MRFTDSSGDLGQTFSSNIIWESSVERKWSAAHEDEAPTKARRVVHRRLLFVLESQCG